MDKHEDFKSTKLSLQNAGTAIDVKDNPVVKIINLATVHISIPISKGLS